MRVVEEIDKARTAAELTHADVAERAALSANYYYKRMRGELPFNTNDIDKIASAIGIDPMSLMYAAAQKFDADK